MSSSICGSCAAHNGWIVALTPSARKPGYVGGGDHLQVFYATSVALPTVARHRGLDGVVERLVDRAVADRVKVHLEVGCVELSTLVTQGDPVHEAQATVSRRAAARVEIAD